MPFKKHPVLQEFDRLSNFFEYYQESERRRGHPMRFAILQSILVLGNS